MSDEKEIRISPRVADWAVFAFVLLGHDLYFRIRAGTIFAGPFEDGWDYFSLIVDVFYAAVPLAVFGYIFWLIRWGHQRR